jgi:SAM-dependent methyltransferase
MADNLIAGRSLDYWLAWEYEKRNTSLPADELAWYLKYSKRATPPVLELACGTGRILLALAQEGIHMRGVDISPGMLQILSEKARSVRLPSRGFETVQSDMSDFAITEKYSLIFVAYNSLQYLGTETRIAELGQRIYSSLSPSGTFLSMTYHRNASWYSQGSRQFEKEAVVHPETGVAISHRVTETLSPDGKTVHRITTHLLSVPGAKPIKRSVTTQVPLLQPDDYRALYEKAGFLVKTYGDYSEDEAVPRGNTACHVAQKR